jgi:hypothetical protein
MYSEIVNNGYFLESIKLSREVKQGCPLLAYLFNMAIEILILKYVFLHYRVVYQ